MKAPRLVLTGTHSGVGKTTLTLGLLAAFRRRGLKVQPYKVGPDYIDPSYHTALTGRPSRNLDCWMLGEDAVREIFLRSNQDADLAVIEGVMGLFDGKDPLSNQGSTAEMSRILKSPVLLVIDAAAMARSAAAVVRGFESFDPSVRIGGVIVNRVGSEGHYQLVKAAIEATSDIPVVGYLLAHQNISIPERHLGLVPAIERGEMNALFETLGDVVSSIVDLDVILEIAHRAEPLEMPSRLVFAPQARQSRAVIAVARDAAFNFYYPENLELLELYGAKLEFFSPLAGEVVPKDATGLYIGGGFPEEFAAELSAHKQVLADMRTRIANGLPTYAECGGYMYLARALTDRSGQVHEMVGVIPATVRMQTRLSGFGYREVEPISPNWLMESGARVRGHEFHYSTIAFDESQPYAYRFPDRGLSEGYAQDNVVAGYTHLHFASHPDVARHFVEACSAYQTNRFKQSSVGGT